MLFPNFLTGNEMKIPKPRNALNTVEEDFKGKKHLER